MCNKSTWKDKKIQFQNQSQKYKTKKSFKKNTD